MSGLPSYSFFNDLNEECSFDISESVNSLEIDQSCNDVYSGCNIDVLPSYNYSTSIKGSLDLCRDETLFNDISNLSDNSYFSSESLVGNSVDLSFQNTINDKDKESILPSSLIDDINLSFSYLENHSQSPQNIYDTISELDLPGTSLTSEHSPTITISEATGIKESNLSDYLPQDKISKASKLPLTLILKKVKSNTNFNMVAPFDNPKSTYTLIRIPGENKCSENISVVTTLQEPNSLNAKKCSELENVKSRSKNINYEPGQEKRILDKSFIRQSEKSICNNINKDEDEQNVNIQELPFTSLKRKLANNSKPNKPVKKKKAYELEPLPDPALEKCRRNAINAKKNREIKKEKMIKLEVEVEKVMQEKLELAEENETLKLKNIELENKVKYLANLLKNDQFKLLWNQMKISTDVQESTEKIIANL